MAIRLWEYISSKTLVRYDKQIFLDIPCIFREENRDMSQARKLDGFSKGFQNLQNKCSGWKLCLLGFGRGFKIYKTSVLWRWIVKMICICMIMLKIWEEILQKFHLKYLGRNIAEISGLLHCFWPSTENIDDLWQQTSLLSQSFNLLYSIL